jgi:DNA-binding winged helix-turn-helix (wHTH) protein/Tol biopolymer transport system component
MLTLQMSEPTTTRHVIRFGVFEVDFRAGELHKSGLKIKLQEQPFEVLAMLLRHPGEVVTREELQKAVWPADTFVDFDRGLNKAINKIREALGDDADNPRFVETLPRRGYRFIAPADVGAGGEPSPGPTNAGPPSPTGRGTGPPAVGSGLHSGIDLAAGGRGSEEAVRELVLRTPWGLRAAALLAMLVVGLGVGWLVWHRSRPLPELKQRPLTSNSEELPVLSGAISPDGKLVAYSDSSGLHLKLPEADEHRDLPWPPGTPSGATWNVAGWFPDGTRLLTNLVQPDGSSSIWTVSVVGQSTRHVRDDAMAWAVSPDGSSIAFTPPPRTNPSMDSVSHENEIWVMGTLGEHPQRVLAAGDNESFGTIQWCPGGGRIAYSQTRQTLNGVEVTLRASDLKGGQPTLAVSDSLQVSPPGVLRPSTFSWLPGGRLIYSRVDPTPRFPTCNLWEVPVDTRTGESSGKPVLLARWVGCSKLEGLSSTADGKRLAFLKRLEEPRAYVGELEAGGTRLGSVRRLTFSNAGDVPWTFTGDGKAVIVTSDRNGELELLKQPLDQETAQPVVTGSGGSMQAWLSPDGSWILYAIYDSAFPTTQLMRVPVNGGPAQQVLEAQNMIDFKCAFSPGTLCVVDEISPDAKSFSVTAFDPVKGRGRVLISIPRDSASTVYAVPSPDGSRFASLKVGEAEGHIGLLAPDGQLERDIRVKGWPGFFTLAWSPDGKAMYCGTVSRLGATLLRVDLDGNAQVLWQQRGADYIYGEPSRDGRYLTIMADVMESNLWMMENF